MSWSCTAFSDERRSTSVLCKCKSVQWRRGFSLLNKQKKYSHYLKGQFTQNYKSVIFVLSLPVLVSSSADNSGFIHVGWNICLRFLSLPWYHGSAWNFVCGTQKAIQNYFKKVQQLFKLKKYPLKNCRQHVAVEFFKCKCFQCSGEKLTSFWGWLQKFQRW